MPIDSIRANRRPSAHAPAPKVTQALCDVLNAKLFPKPGQANPPPFAERPPRAIGDLLGGFEVNHQKNAFIVNLTVDPEWSLSSLKKQQRELEAATSQYLRRQFSKDPDLRVFSSARFEFFWSRPPYV